ncbi:MAG: hypothetical protein U0930_08835 [Pirellulales bacterium]
MQDSRITALAFSLVLFSASVLLQPSAVGQVYYGEPSPVIVQNLTQPVVLTPIHTEQKAQASVNSSQVTNSVYEAPIGSTTSSPTVISASYVAPSAESRTEKLEILLNEARKSLDKERVPKIEPAKEQLKAALDQLEQFIVVDSENGKRWSNFLRLPEIRDQVKGKPSFVKLLDLEMNMRQNYLGLEYPQFVRLREALLKCAYAARFVNQEDKFMKFMDDAMNHVINESKKPDVDPRAITNHLVTVVNNLHHSNQATSQVQQIRSLYGAQNVKVHIEESLVKRLAARPVAQPRDVNECILGTRVLGTAFMNGDVSVDLIPMSNGVGLKLDLNACMTSQSRGYNRGVVLNTVSSSPVWASKQVFLSDSGISSPAASISTNLQSTIQSIEHKSRLVRKIASKKAAQQKPQADAIAEDKLQTRICSEFTQQVDEQVALAQPKLAQFRNGQTPELGRVGVSKPQVSLSSSDSAIFAAAKQAEVYQLAAEGDCPLPRPASAAFVGQIHESAIANAISCLLAGRTVRNTSLGDYVKQVTGKIPDDLKDEIEGEDWSMTFNPSQPVRIEFVGNNVALTVRLIKMTRGKQVLEEALSINAKYLPQIVDNRLTLTRQGEVEVTSDKQTTGTMAAALRAFLKNKFDKTFRESIVSEPITAERLGQKFPKASNLNFDINKLAISIDQGWLQLAMPL